MLALLTTITRERYVPIEASAMFKDVQEEGAAQQTRQLRPREGPQLSV